ncbi:MAG: hypothetical protein GY820_35900 [Gammaproteobacteria bacterium]|nr:hypothetical protein [Gammaproteobacteria bacterium]
MVDTGEIIIRQSSGTYEIWDWMTSSKRPQEASNKFVPANRLPKTSPKREVGTLRLERKPQKEKS